MNFSVTLTPRFLKKSYADRLFYDLWKLGAAFVFAVVAAFVLYGDPGTKTFAIFIFCVVGVTIALMAAVWLHQSKQIDEWYARQGDKPVNYFLAEDAIETTSEVGSSKLKWGAFSKIRISDQDTLLFYSKAAALTLPTNQVSAETLNYLKGRFSFFSKPIDDRRKKANQSPEPTAPSGRGSA